jgi:hypothetical protein
MGADIAFYVGAPNVDGWYDVDTMNADVETIIAESGHLFGDVQQFNDDQFDEFGAWVDDNTNDGELDILWLNGCVPSVLYPYPNVQPDGSRIEEWLDGGNMIINVGDWFGYVSYEGGPRQTENGSAGAANILDLSAGIIVSADNTSLTVTPTGREYLPSLGGGAVITYRPIVLSAVQAPWEVAALFASTGGTDDAATEAQADPLVIYNTETDAYVAFINQSSGSGPPGWLDDRGLTCAEFINNWVTEAIGFGANPLARAPNPKNGSMIQQTTAILTWRPGDFADVHNVYFGDDADAVAAATPEDADIFVGTLSTEMVVVGIGADALVPGATYYWRVDEVNDANTASPWTGDVWNFRIQPAVAYQPFPADGMRNVDPDQDLTWEAGIGTIFHQVAFGTSFEEVRDAPVGAWMTVDPIYDPGTMELDTTYYWRVDEFKGMTTEKGDVWSFTIRGEGGGVEAEYFDGMALAGNPILTQIEPSIDNTWGSGEVAAGLSDLVSARWRANLEAPFTEPVRLITTSDDGVRLYVDGRLVIDNWTDHGTTDNTATIDMVAGQYHMIVMEWYENGGGAVAQLSWQSDSLPRQIIPQGWLQLPVRATSPSPMNNEPSAAQDSVLSWAAGDDATGHHVYFGDDADAVANADTATAGVYRGQQAAEVTTYNPGPLEWGKTYYWRVDEIHPDGVQTGAVWSFTAANFIVIDDFEAYDNEVGSRPFEVWVDGVGFTLPAPGNPGNGSNALVGHDVWDPASPYYNGLLMETGSVHGGAQSMPVDYNNVISPNYSEIERTWVAPQNWTVNGVDTLTLHVRGSGNNTEDRFYVTLTDSTGGSATVEIADTSILTSRDWSVVTIPMADFAGVNAAAIKKMVVGLGNPPAAGGAGSLLFDDFRVTVGE